ncbi:MULTISPECIES: c-type cytochrome [Microbulbifer]|uniref:c-type cytochrome n=1 Tax=Microbulbifer TaxID=48073 RepID=UPI001CD421AC|nr:cytochrome c [Microbulbifer agarilyticus]MCA0900118.1 cytochrome c [Microbulbifer agarilyticus]
MHRRLLWLYVITIALAGSLLAGWHAVAQEIWDEAAAASVNKELNRADLIEKGRYLSVAADCKACHTAEGGSVYAGGRALHVPLLGTLYSSNITPDIATGIGGWTLQEFDRALREGIGKDGRNLYPAMPYVSYAKIIDEDIKALYAYFLFGVAPVHERPPPNKIPQLLSARWPLYFWNLLFTPNKPFEPNPQKSDAWNRGAYLVQGPAHCGECHTPRGLAFQAKAFDETKKGFLAGGPVLDGWEAYNITPDPIGGIGKWTEEQLTQYLKTGHVNRLAQAGGSMAEAIENSLANMHDSDIAAIVTYLRDIPPVKGRVRMPRQSLGNPATDVVILRGNPLSRDIDPRKKADGARLYLGFCATCHGVDGTGSKDGYYPSLIRNSTVGAKDDHNLRQAILEGISRTIDGEEKMMPGFANKMDEEQLKRLMNYLRAQFAVPPRQTPEPNN